MAKSGENFLTLNVVREKNINPIAYRLWVLMGHYRSNLNFNWSALEGVQTALKKLYGSMRTLQDITPTELDPTYHARFLGYINDDLDTPRALTVLWDVLKDETLSPETKKATLLDMDKVLGLGLDNPPVVSIPPHVLSLADARLQARKEKRFEDSDKLRAEIETLGYNILDSGDSYQIEIRI